MRVHGHPAGLDQGPAGAPRRRARADAALVRRRAPRGRAVRVARPGFAGSRSREGGVMRIFDPHIHMSSRTTNDYQAMYDAGVRALVEPAFWLGQPRTSVGSFTDYFDSLLGWEPFRAAQFGIAHHCAIALNPKEANDRATWPTTGWRRSARWATSPRAPGARCTRDQRRRCGRGV